MTFKYLLLIATEGALMHPNERFFRRHTDYFIDKIARTNAFRIIFCGTNLHKMSTPNGPFFGIEMFENKLIYSGKAKDAVMMAADSDKSFANVSGCENPLLCSLSLQSTHSNAQFSFGDVFFRLSHIGFNYHNTIAVDSEDRRWFRTFYQNNIVLPAIPSRNTLNVQDSALDHLLVYLMRLVGANPEVVSVYFENNRFNDLKTLHDESHESDDEGMAEKNISKNSDESGNESNFASFTNDESDSEDSDYDYECDLTITERARTSEDGSVSSDASSEIESDEELQTDEIDYNKEDLLAHISNELKEKCEIHTEHETFLNDSTIRSCTIHRRVAIALPCYVCNCSVCSVSLMDERGLSGGKNESLSQNDSENLNSEPTEESQENGDDPEDMISNAVQEMAL